MVTTRTFRCKRDTEDKLEALEKKLTIQVSTVIETSGPGKDGCCGKKEQDGR